VRCEAGIRTDRVPFPIGLRAMAEAGRLVRVEPGWRSFLDDAESDIDWWIDPALVSGEARTWYPDDGLVFGVEVGGEAVAFPKNVMEVRELVNITIGGRRLGIPYCTLCGSAQAYRTDEVPAGTQPLVLRTSGLLSRSNKVMYDLNTMSVFDTFTGAAVSGPLQDAGVVLDQDTVTVTTWGEWKAAHPDTRIVAEDGGIGRTYDLDPLRGRDDNGPIFPTGEVDPRLPVQEPVVGVITGDGVPVAFPAAAARTALADGDEVVASSVELFDDGGGLRARTADGNEVPAHEAFWFAWSQFHPTTELWLPS
jgi:hypothetical protein